MPAQPLLDLRRILLHPAIDGGVIDAHAAFAHHLLEIAVAHPVTAVPPHRPQHDLALEVAPLEVRRGPVPSLSLGPHPAGQPRALQQSALIAVDRLPKMRYATSELHVVRIKPHNLALHRTNAPASYPLSIA
jgi:hypothetical protein